MQFLQHSQLRIEYACALIRKQYARHRGLAAFCRLAGRIYAADKRRKPLLSNLLLQSGIIRPAFTATYLVFGSMV